MPYIFQYKLSIKTPIVNSNNENGFENIQLIIHRNNFKKFELWLENVKKWEKQNNLSGNVVQEEIHNIQSLNKIFSNNLTEVGSSVQVKEITVNFSDLIKYKKNMFGFKSNFAENYDEVFNLFKQFWVKHIESFVSDSCNIGKAREILNKQFSYPEKEEKTREVKNKFL